MASCVVRMANSPLLILLMQVGLARPRSPSIWKELWSGTTLIQTLLFTLFCATAKARSQRGSGQTHARAMVRRGALGPGRRTLTLLGSSREDLRTMVAISCITVSFETPRVD